jgi:four helix bundle protein
MAVKSYTELVAWQKSVDLVTTVYQLSQHFPKEEVYGLTSQIRRAAISVPSNIAEGRVDSPQANSSSFSDMLAALWPR